MLPAPGRPRILPKGSSRVPFRDRGRAVTVVHTLLKPGACQDERALPAAVWLQARGGVHTCRRRTGLRPLHPPRGSPPPAARSPMRTLRRFRGALGEGLRPPILWPASPCTREGCGNKGKAGGVPPDNRRRPARPRSWGALMGRERACGTFWRRCASWRFTTACLARHKYLMRPAAVSRSYPPS